MHTVTLCFRHLPSRLCNNRVIIQQNSVWELNCSKREPFKTWGLSVVWTWTHMVIETGADGMGKEHLNQSHGGILSHEIMRYEKASLLQKFNITSTQLRKFSISKFQKNETCYIFQAEEVFRIWKWCILEEKKLAKMRSLAADTSNISLQDVMRGGNQAKTKLCNLWANLT